MISSVSSISFKSNATVDPISRPGTYTKPDAINQNPEQTTKKSTGKKVLAATLILAAIVAAGVGLGHLAKFGKLDKLVQKENFLGQIGKGLKTAGDWLNANVIDKVTGLFTKKVATDVAEKVA